MEPTIISGTKYTILKIGWEMRIENVSFTENKKGRKRILSAFSAFLFEL